MKALHGAGWLAHHQRDLAEARELLGESLAIARELDDRVDGRLGAPPSSVASPISKMTPAGALARSRRAWRGRGVGDEWLIAWALHLLGMAAYIEADYPTARAYYERSLAIRRELGFQEGDGILLMLLGIVAVRQGDLGRSPGVVSGQAWPRSGIAWDRGAWPCPWPPFRILPPLTGEPGRAVRLGATATRLRDAYQTPLIPLIEPFLAQGLDAARHALDELTYAQAWAEGQAMSLETAIAEALAVDIAPVTVGATPDGQAKATLFGNLTPTELQVLRQLVGGNTTKEIAAELVVAISTVDRHITHIYAKLGARNRAEAAAIALKTGLGRRPTEGFPSRPTPGLATTVPRFHGWPRPAARLASWT